VNRQSKGHKIREGLEATVGQVTRPFVIKVGIV
jgi:hypothetical protein